MKRAGILFVLLAIANTTIQSQTKNQSDVFIAIQNDDLESVRAFVEVSPGLINEADKNGMTPLYYAAYYGKTEIVDYLIEKDPT